MLVKDILHGQKLHREMGCASRWLQHDNIAHNQRQTSECGQLVQKKTEFYKRQEQREADRPELKDGSSFMDKETYDSLPLTRWLD